MLILVRVLLLGFAAARSLPDRRDEWQAPSTCFYMTTDAGWKGFSNNFCQTPSYCVNTLPSAFQGNISSAGPDEGQACFLYSAENCKGDRSPPLLYPGESDLTNIGFNDKTRSFRCWVLCGYVDGSLPPQSSASSVSSSSSKTVNSTSTAAVSITTTLNGDITGVADITVSLTTPASSSSTLQPVSINSTVSDIRQPSPQTVTITHTYADGAKTVITTALPAPTRV